MFVNRMRIATKSSAQVKVIKSVSVLMVVSVTSHPDGAQLIRRVRRKKSIGALYPNCADITRVMRRGLIIRSVNGGRFWRVLENS